MTDDLPATTTPSGEVVQGGQLRTTCQFALTDRGNGERFAFWCKGLVLYVKLWATWLVWCGTHFAPNDLGQVQELAKKVADLIATEALLSEQREKHLRWAAQSGSLHHIQAMIKAAESEPCIAVRPANLDADPLLLNTLSGTIDLRTAELRPHNRGDRITKVCPVEYRPRGPYSDLWARHLHTVFAGDTERMDFLKRWTGYGATGLTTERKIAVYHGQGRNGKSTTTETIEAALGDYACTTPPDTLMTKRGSDIPNDVARLAGVRSVFCGETDESRRLAEARVKGLSGGDTVTARFMRGEWFDFRPQFKLTLHTNHKPTIRGTDDAVWDRLVLVPFDVRIPEDQVNLNLQGELREELPGVLSWIVDGALEWQQRGLDPPDSVKAATSSYRAEQDVLANFLSDCTTTNGGEVTTKRLYLAYEAWCSSNGEKPLSQRQFSTRLKERGIEPAKHVTDADGERRRGWTGIALSE